ncbi:MAG: YraN family protein [Chloroflexota bacterium]
MPTLPIHSLGQRGEQLAIEYLKHRGYLILATNWRCKNGEIDIVAQKADTLIFVEVRTRHADNTESAFESITLRKHSRMIAAAQAYIAEKALDDMDWRVDMIGIAIPYRGAPIIDYAEDVLGW